MRYASSIRLRSVAFHLLSLIVLLCAICLSSAKLHAQGTAYPPMTMKVGDRVEVDIITQHDPSKSKYKKATITKVDMRSHLYMVEIDALPGQLPQEMSILVREEGKHWIRPLAGGGAAPKVPTEKLRVDANDTVLADRPVLDYRTLDLSGKNGKKPPVDLIKKMIRCLYEKPSNPGQDGAQTVDILSLTVGTPRKWNRLQDLGQGNINTIVWPLYVKYNHKTFYRTRNVLVTGAENTCTCFVDGNNKWVAGFAHGPEKAGIKVDIRVVP